MAENKKIGKQPRKFLRELNAGIAGGVIAVGIGYVMSGFGKLETYLNNNTDGVIITFVIGMMIGGALQMAYAKLLDKDKDKTE